MSWRKLIDVNEDGADKRREIESFLAQWEIPFQAQVSKTYRYTRYLVPAAKVDWIKVALSLNDDAPLPPRAA
jgi:hypothetical protein